MKKKLLKHTLFISLAIWFIWSFCFWLDIWWNWEIDEDFPYQDEHTSTLIKCDGNTDLWNCTSIKEDKESWNETIIRRLLWVFGLDSSKERDLKFIDYAKAIMNIALWLISFITLVMTIYTFYMMIFSDNEAWIKKAKWNLIGIFTALAIIWLARLIVSFIFRWYQSNWKRKQDVIPTGNITMINNESINKQIYLTI